MPRVSLAFYAVSFIYLMVDMTWGQIMGESGDHTLFPAHAHLNLIGGVIGGALYGSFYAHAREQVSGRLAWVNFALTNVGVIVMAAALVPLLQTGDEAKYGPIVGAGGGLVMLGLLLFGGAVLRLFFKRG